MALGKHWSGWLVASIVRKGGFLMDLADILSVGTLVVIAITMIISAWQSYNLMKQTSLLAEEVKAKNKINTASVALNINSMMHGLSRLLVDRPELYPYIYGGLPVPEEEPLRTRVLAVAEMFIDFMSMTLDHAPLLADESVVGWRKYFGDLVAGSAVLQYWWRENRSWYETAVKDLLDPFAFPGEVPAELETAPAAGEAASAALTSADEVAGEAAELHPAAPGACEPDDTGSLTTEPAQPDPGSVASPHQKPEIQAAAADERMTMTPAADKPRP